MCSIKGCKRVYNQESSGVYQNFGDTYESGEEN